MRRSDHATADEAVAQIVASAASQLELGLSGRQHDALAGYVDQLHRWNRVYNLTAARDSQAIAREHVVDCLAIVPPLRRELGSRGGPILDAGSGAGLPGLVLAIALPEVDVVCVEPVGKKAAFLRQVAGRLGLVNVSVEGRRVEDLTDQLPSRLITSRAYASLATLVAGTEQLLAPGGCWASMKAEHAVDEAGQLPTHLMFHVEPLDVPELDAVRNLVWIARRAERESLPP